MTYDFPTETGEQRLQNAIDRRRTIGGWLFVALMIAAGGIWLWSEANFGADWNLLWAIPLTLVFLGGVLWAFEKLDEAVSSIIPDVFRPLRELVRMDTYSRLSDPDRNEERPDYSMAEVIVDEGDPQSLPEKEDL